MRNVIIAAFMVAGIPAMAYAAGPAEEAAAAEAAKKTQEEKGGPNAYVCKKMPPPVGTRLRARQICKTQAEWDMMEEDTQDGLRKMQRKPFQGS
ncbi:hypothetical protein [Sphingomicrobium lutaoense]|uniref:Uncharacterized protein n=1 Tax=Sphingomicrobium lutaoense TaxID=515949 RepID=A0A839Z722_9SPHN|nr:hypothetical protein [Sphingomicrobium lutaoense]MBB3764574.1 hypothetical protein [Sphingomicrobium lutaoense]